MTKMILDWKIGDPRLKFFIQSRVSRNNNDCWLWDGSKDSKGYGLINVEGKRQRVSRVAYHAFKGAIPMEMVVCHKCDNVACCNPKHLFIGTQKDNILDAKSKGRIPRGSRRPNAKLTERNALAILFLVQNGVTRELVARAFGVSCSTITNILNGKSWTHIRTEKQKE